MFEELLADLEIRRGESGALCDPREHPGANLI
jgi:hypothetical protein